MDKFYNLENGTENNQRFTGGFIEFKRQHTELFLKKKSYGNK